MTAHNRQDPNYLDEFILTPNVAIDVDEPHQQHNKPPRNRQDPDHFDAFVLAPHINIEPDNQHRQNIDLKRPTRRYLYPLIRFMSKILIVIIMCIKRVLPFLGSEYLLNKLGVWFINTMVSPEATYYFLQHFHTEANLINFLARNSKGDNVHEVDLKPTSIDQLGNNDGVNAIKLHDINLYNLILDLGHSHNANVSQRVPLDKLDFSMLTIDNIDVEPNRKRLINLDMDTSLYIMGIFMALFFTDREIERAITSLQFDESIMVSLAKLTGDDQFKHWTPMKFTNWLGYSSDPIRDLRWHMMVHDYAHAYLKKLNPN
ncbi:hypothetical protein [uncultured Shewanella sp.]|uniref:DUF6999 family protein n=1 Tax=uncultured Shewanella sp. TaxID=173975 RepID=UPI002627ABFD|nr:hypothetical protein [uncultured Shewanella sp.]